jgi:hypothetical protein
MAKVCSTSFNLARSSCAHLKRFEASTSLGFWLDRALVFDEKQLSDDEFIEMQIRANLVVPIHQGGHRAIASAGGLHISGKTHTAPFSLE